MLQPAIRARKMPVIEGRHIAAPQENMRIRSDHIGSRGCDAEFVAAGTSGPRRICINSGAIEGDEA
jgi:hypothetical protein